MTDHIAERVLLKRWARESDFRYYAYVSADELLRRLHEMTTAFARIDDVVYFALSRARLYRLHRWWWILTRRWQSSWMTWHGRMIPGGRARGRSRG